MNAATVTHLAKSQWVIDIRSQWLSGNHRLPWYKASPIKRNIRDEVMAKARLQAIPNLTGACLVRLEYTPTRGRGPDPDNLWPTAKAAVDGLQRAGVLDDDTQADVDRAMNVVLATDCTLRAPLVRLIVIRKGTPC